MLLYTDSNRPVLVKRVVEARKQHASGMRPDFPSLVSPAPQQPPHQPQASSVQQTAAPGPISGYSEKPSQAQSAEANKAAQAKTAPPKKSFFSSLRCW